MVMYAKIRRMFFREHLSISEIARRTTLTRNTIKKWLKTLLVWSTIYNYVVIYTFNSPGQNSTRTGGHFYTRANTLYS